MNVNIQPFIGLALQCTKHVERDEVLIHGLRKESLVHTCLVPQDFCKFGMSMQHSACIKPRPIRGYPEVRSCLDSCLQENWPIAFTVRHPILILVLICGLRTCLQAESIEKKILSRSG